MEYLALTQDIAAVVKTCPVVLEQILHIRVTDLSDTGHPTDFLFPLEAREFKIWKNQKMLLLNLNIYILVLEMVKMKHVYFYY